MQVVVRSLNVLRVLSKAPQGLTLNGISEAVVLPVATAHRIVGVLESQQFVTRSGSNKRYFLGPAARELYEAEQWRESPLVLPHPSVAHAHKQTGETVYLAQLIGDKAVCLSLCASDYPLQLYVRIGQELPWHATAPGRVLLAHRERSYAEHILRSAPLRAYTPRTMTDVDRLLDHLGVVRDRGFDTVESELDQDVWAVSAPVFSSTGAVLAAITLAAPVTRFADQPTREHALDVVKEAALVASTDLGWVSPTA